MKRTHTGPAEPSTWRATMLASLIDIEYDLEQFGGMRCSSDHMSTPNREDANAVLTDSEESTRHSNSDDSRQAMRLPEAEVVCTAIESARAIATDRRRWSWRPLVLARWLGGGRIDLAFRYLHSAEHIVARMLPPGEVYARSPELICKYEKALDDKDDFRLIRLKRELLEIDQATEVNTDSGSALSLGQSEAVVPLPGRGDVECDHADVTTSAQTNEGPGLGSKAVIYAAALKSTYDILDQNHVGIRKLRNGLYFGVIVLGFIVTAFCIVAWIAPDSVPLCFRPPSENANLPDWVCPSGSGFGRTNPGSADVTLVALLGLLGAALSSAIFVSRLPTTQSSQTISYALALFKLPVGSLSAIAGILLVHGAFVPGLSQLDTQAQILAYAFVFGFAQQLITSVVDRQAGSIISKVPEKSASPSPKGDDAS